MRKVKLNLGYIGEDNQENGHQISLQDLDFAPINHRNV